MTASATLAFSLVDPRVAITADCTHGGSRLVQRSTMMLSDIASPAARLMSAKNLEGFSSPISSSPSSRLIFCRWVSS
uniref:Putative secreted protein n=1 Tax=Anopheles marajoara TaxID=58244 RepID=A0A2M4CCZ2_9DIPT